ncbi:MAG: hypothetical protein WCG32_00585 [Actinomycetes bacterium]
MTKFDNKNFQKKLKKKIKKSIGKNKNLTIKAKSGFYSLGFVGAAVFYISTATDFWMGVLGILKAIVWPAFLVFAALQNLAS